MTRDDRRYKFDRSACCHATRTGRPFLSRCCPTWVAHVAFSALSFMGYFYHDPFFGMKKRCASACHIWGTINNEWNHKRDARFLCTKFCNFFFACFRKTIVQVPPLTFQLVSYTLLRSTIKTPLLLTFVCSATLHSMPEAQKYIFSVVRPHRRPWNAFTHFCTWKLPLLP